ncbi:SHOCT domain-containing protein [uncultured Megasphaera sp.]|uniref:SHOCT domain-containing protein n=2 Tax=uncultured Megasphaera sp. TaxID=165188 RepID=UPI0025964924|nr:SHOCT domain-containing protein [uncultured Megasphaera sp.]
MSTFVLTANVHLPLTASRQENIVAMIVISNIGLEVSIMRSIKEAPPTADKARRWTKDTMQADFSFEIAEKLMVSLLQKGFITGKEKEQISRLNREDFAAFYRELMD